MKPVILFLFFIPTMLFAQQTYVPDDNFEQALIDLGLDEGPLDDYVLTESIDSVTILDISELQIEDLSGIEDFIDLDTLYCYSNRLTSLDVSKNIDMEYLDCNYNNLTALDVSKNIDLVSLHCGRNQLTALDVSKNIDLELLEFSGNNLTAIDVSKNIDMEYLICRHNQLTAIDVSKNIDLVSLHCYENELTAIDVSKNIDLEYLDCGYNQLTALDVSKNTILWKLVCLNNELKRLNVQNGNYMNLTLYAHNNPDLYCIQVDDPDWSENYSGWTKDEHTEWSEDCGYTDVPIEPTSTFSISPNPATDFINIETESLAEEIEIYNMLGMPVLKTIGSGQIDVSGLPRGMYILKIDKKTFTKLILN